MSIGARPAARTPETGARAQPWFAHRRSTWYPLAWTPLLLAGPLLSAMVRADAAQVLTVLLLAGLHLATVLLRHRSGAGPATEVLVVLTTAVVVVYQVAWDAHQVFLYPLLALGMATGIRPRRALGVVGALAVSGAVAAGITTGSVAQALVLAVLTYMAGFSAHLIGCLVETAAALAATRERLARAAVVEERERFSRDLHDLLGHTLSVIVVKAEAARRFAAADPAVAAEHAEGIERIGRSALDQVREAVVGYRTTSLREELEEAERALRDAGVRGEIHGADVPLPAEVEQVLAWVVREGSTNVIRHADARRCRILIEAVGGEATVEITDDGAAVGRAGEPRAVRTGSGLAGLRTRIEHCGGVLVAGPDDAGFRLGVSVPLQPPGSGGGDGA